MIEDAVEAVDVVLLWQRDDADVGDSLVNANPNWQAYKVVRPESSWR